MKFEQALAISNPKGTRVNSKGINDYNFEVTQTQQAKDRKKRFEEILNNKKEMEERKKKFGTDEEYQKQCQKYDKKNPS